MKKENRMIKCKNTDCMYEHCCIECDTQKSQAGQCGCNIAENLFFDKDEILKKCEYAMPEPYKPFAVPDEEMGEAL